MVYPIIVVPVSLNGKVIGSARVEKSQIVCEIEDIFLTEFKELFMNGLAHSLFVAPNYTQAYKSQAKHRKHQTTEEQ